MLALTEYARRVEGTRGRTGGSKWGGESVAFRLDDRTNLFTQTFPLTNFPARRCLSNASSNRLYTSVLIEARPPETQQPPQDRGFAVQRHYARLDDDNQPQELRPLRVGDRVLVTLRLTVRDHSLAGSRCALPASSKR